MNDSLKLMKAFYLIGSKLKTTSNVRKRYLRDKGVLGLVCFWSCAALLCGCHEPIPILICPPGCIGQISSSDMLKDCLFEQAGFYFLTDQSGKPVESFRYGHEAGLMPFTTDRATPARLGNPVILKQGTAGVILHVMTPRGTNSIDLGSAHLEMHRGQNGEYRILYVE